MLGFLGRIPSAILSFLVRLPRKTSRFRSLIVIGLIMIQEASMLWKLLVYCLLYGSLVDLILERFLLPSL